MSNSSLIRENIARLGDGPNFTGYGSARTDIKWRLHHNESPFPPPASVIEAVSESASKLNYYPDGRALALRTALSKRDGVPVEQVAIGNGSSELLFNSAFICLQAGDHAIAPHPSFYIYRKSAAMYGADFTATTLRSDGIPDLKQVLAAIRPQTKLISVTTPNNPTGGMLTKEELQKFVTQVPDNVLLVLDEAYCDFGMHAGGPNALEILQTSNKRWLSVRTFSKAYSLAGARIGYAYASDPEIAAALDKVRSTFNCDSLSLAAAIAALADLDYQQDLLDQLATQRKKLITSLEPLGYKCFPSAANFVTFHASGKAEAILRALVAKGILIKELTSDDLPGYLRITLGPEEVMDQVISIIKEC